MPSRSQRKRLVIIIYSTLVVSLVGYLLYKGVENFSKSLFIRSNDRINFVVYGQETAFYSYDRGKARHYLMYFSPDIKVQVPGGYGRYRVGSLGKLAQLEKDPELLKRAFSMATTSFVDYYFSDNSEEVYYGKFTKEKPSRPSFLDILKLDSNSGIFDRMYLLFVILTTSSEDYNIIQFEELKNAQFNDIYFGQDSFVKNSIGLLYQKSYRDEQKSVQIVYNGSYETAQHLGNLLEGNGIRVSDITAEKTKVKKCRVLEDSNKHSTTAVDISRFFNCELQLGKTDFYDVIVTLGDLEDEWKIIY